MGDDKRLPHHISSIAHHFFAAASETGAGLSSANGPGSKDFHFVVAAPGRSHLAAWTTVRLARASLPVAGTGGAGLPLRVVLSECHRQAWSVRSFLDGLDEPHLRSLFRPPTVVDGFFAEANCSSLVLGSWPDESNSSVSPSCVPSVSWHNFGCCTESVLRRMSDFFTSASRYLDSPSTGVDGLIWCPLAEEADSSSGAWLLGSLASILGCRQAKILLFPASRDIGGQGVSPFVSGRGHLDSCRRVYEAALNDCTFEALSMPTVRAGSEADRELWSRLAESMKMGAVGQRRQRRASLEESA